MYHNNDDGTSPSSCNPRQPPTWVRKRKRVNKSQEMKKSFKSSPNHLPNMEDTGGTERSLPSFDADIEKCFQMKSNLEFTCGLNEENIVSLLRKNGKLYGNYFKISRSLISDEPFIGLIEKEISPNKFRITPVDAEIWKRDLDGNLEVCLNFLSSQDDVVRLFVTPKSNIVSPFHIPYCLVSQNLVICDNIFDDFAMLQGQLIHHQLGNRLVDEIIIGHLIANTIENCRTRILEFDSRVQSLDLSSLSTQLLQGLLTTYGGIKNISANEIRDYWKFVAYSLEIVKKLVILWNEGTIYGFASRKEILKKLNENPIVGSFAVFISSEHHGTVEICRIDSLAPIRAVYHTIPFEKITTELIVQHIVEYDLKRFLRKPTPYGQCTWGMVQLQ